MRRPRYRGGHLAECLEEYVDGAMGERESGLAARHVAVCTSCREDVEAERDIMRRLRHVEVNPARQADLMAGLLTMKPAAEQHSEQQAVTLALVSPGSPAQYDRRRRAQVIGVAVVAAGCAAAVTTLSVTPQRTAPGEGRLTQVSSPRLLDDDLDAPKVQAVTYRGAAWAHSPLEAVLPKDRASGTIGP